MGAQSSQYSYFQEKMNDFYITDQKYYEDLLAIAEIEITEKYDGKNLESDLMTYFIYNCLVNGKTLEQLKKIDSKEFEDLYVKYWYKKTK